MENRMTTNNVRLCKSIVLISVLLFWFDSTALPAKQTHPVSVGIRLNGTRILPTNEEIKTGYGIDGNIQFDFTRNLSLIASLGYLNVGKDYSVPADDFERSYWRYNDFLFNIGLKYSLVTSGIMPYAAANYSSHNFKRKLLPEGREYEKFSTGFSPAAGAEFYVGKYWLLDMNICFHLADYLDYAAFRIGIRHIFIR
jgi:hypothetical protein